METKERRGRERREIRERREKIERREERERQQEREREGERESARMYMRACVCVCVCDVCLVLCAATGGDFELHTLRLIQ